MSVSCSNLPVSAQCSVCKAAVVHAFTCTRCVVDRVPNNKELLCSRECLAVHKVKHA